MKEGHLSIDLAPSINSTRPDIHNRKEKQEERLAKIIIGRRMRGEEEMVKKRKETTKNVCPATRQ